MAMSEAALAARRRYKKEWRQRNAERVRAYQKDWYAAHPEKRREYYRTFCKRHPEKRREYEERYYEKKAGEYAELDAMEGSGKGKGQA